MRPTRTTRSLLLPPLAARALLGPLAAAALLLAACSGPAPDDDAPSSGRTEESPAAPDKAADPDKGGAADVSAAASCIVGEWVTDPASIEAVTVASSGLVGMDMNVVVTGDSIVAFGADGTISTSYVDQVVEFTVAVQGQEMHGVTRANGLITGFYTATDTEITQFDLDTSGLTMQTEISLDGEPMDRPDSSQNLLAASEAGGTLTFTCSGNQMQTVPVVPGVDTSAYATVLHRR